MCEFKISIYLQGWVDKSGQNCKAYNRASDSNKKLKICRRHVGHVRHVRQTCGSCCQQLVTGGMKLPRCGPVWSVCGQCRLSRPLAARSAGNSLRLYFSESVRRDCPSIRRRQHSFQVVTRTAIVNFNIPSFCLYNQTKKQLSYTVGNNHHGINTLGRCRQTELQLPRLHEREDT